MIQMAPKQPLSLAEMAANAAQSNGGRVECPQCGGTDFRVYGTPQRSAAATIRYKFCRHCKNKIVTRTRHEEEIIHDIGPMQANSEPPDLEL